MSKLPQPFPAAIVGVYGEIISSERAGSDRCAKGEETGQNIVSIFFVSAQKAVLDQQEGIIANALGRILPASLFIRGNPQNQLDRLCRNQFQSLSSAKDFQISATIGKMLPILIVSV